MIPIKKLTLLHSSNSTKFETENMLKESITDQQLPDTLREINYEFASFNNMC